MANVNLQGSIVILNLYDIAEEINLSDLPQLIGGTRLSSTFKHPAPEHVRFERPPVIEPLAPLFLATGERFEATLQYYDYGVVSVLLRFGFPAHGTNYSGWLEPGSQAPSLTISAGTQSGKS